MGKQYGGGTVDRTGTGQGAMSGGDRVYRAVLPATTGTHVAWESCTGKPGSRWVLGLSCLLRGILKPFLCWVYPRFSSH